MTRLLDGVTGAGLRDLSERLLSLYGPQGWWPGETRLEIALGAVLVQRTRWRNARLALQNLAAAGIDSPAAVLAHPPEALEALVRPAGFYRQKAARIRGLCEWLADAGGFDALGDSNARDLRRSLLGIQGIGPETADCILLYALERPVFIADAYARRLFQRLGWCPMLAASDYDRLRSRVEQEVNEQVAFYNEFHALIVRHGKTFCTSKPRCEDCSLQSICGLGREVTPARR